MNNQKKKKITVIAVVAVILAVIIIPSTIYCIVNQETPVEMAKDMFSTNEEQIVGKWQHETKATAYEFKPDGTCVSHISILKTTNEYTIDGNELTMTNTNAEGTKDVYKISVKESKLSMTLIEMNGVEVPKDEQTTWEYNKVSKITTQRLDDLLYGAAEDAEEEN